VRGVLLTLRVSLADTAMLRDENVAFLPIGRFP
jgi:hypothetical protein